MGKVNDVKGRFKKKEIKRNILLLPLVCEENARHIFGAKLILGAN